MELQQCAENIYTGAKLPIHRFRIYFAATEVPKNGWDVQEGDFWRRCQDLHVCIVAISTGIPSEIPAYVAIGCGNLSQKETVKIIA